MEGQAAKFVGTDLSEATITAHFSFDDMRGAHFSDAHMTVVMANLIKLAASADAQRAQ